MLYMDMDIAQHCRIEKTESLNSDVQYRVRFNEVPKNIHREFTPRTQVPWVEIWARVIIDKITKIRVSAFYSTMFCWIIFVESRQVKRFAPVLLFKSSHFLSIEMWFPSLIYINRKQKWIIRFRLREREREWAKQMNCYVNKESINTDHQSYQLYQ